MKFGDIKIDESTMEAYCNHVFAHSNGGWLLGELMKRATYNHMGRCLTFARRDSQGRMHPTHVDWTGTSRGIDVNAIEKAVGNDKFRTTQKLLAIAARQHRVILRRHFFSTLPRCAAYPNGPRTREQLEQAYRINWNHLYLASLAPTPLIIEHGPDGALGISSYRAMAWQEPPTIVKP